MSDFGCAIHITAGGGTLTDTARKMIGDFFDKLREGENFYDAAGDPFVYRLEPAVDAQGKVSELEVILSHYHTPEEFDDEMLALTLNEDRACAEAIVKMLSDRFGKPLQFSIFAGRWAR